MSTPTSTNTRGFRREPGDWHCQRCDEINFRSRSACRRCSTPRNQSVQANSTANTATNVTPQIMPRSGDWTCHFCNNINFAARIACNKCGRQKQEPMDTNAAPPVISKPGDWKCSSCPEMNFGSRIVCRSCGTARPSNESNNNNNDDKKSECVICMENPIDSVITTCGHSAVCLRCGTQITQCPVCRNTFSQQQLIKLYHVH